MSRSSPHVAKAVTSWPRRTRPRSSTWYHRAAALPNGSGGSTMTNTMRNVNLRPAGHALIERRHRALHVPALPDVRDHVPHDRPQVALRAIADQPRGLVQARHAAAHVFETFAVRFG